MCPFSRYVPILLESLIKFLMHSLEKKEAHAKRDWSDSKQPERTAGSQPSPRRQPKPHKARHEAPQEQKDETIPEQLRCEDKKQKRTTTGTAPRKLTIIVSRFSLGTAHYQPISESPVSLPMSSIPSTVRRATSLTRTRSNSSRISFLPLCVLESGSGCFVRHSQRQGLETTEVLDESETTNLNPS